MRVQQKAVRANRARQTGNMVQLLANQTFRPDYRQIANRFSSTHTWFRFMTEQLPEKIAILGKELI